MSLLKELSSVKAKKDHKEMLMDLVNDAIKSVKIGKMSYEETVAKIMAAVRAKDKHDCTSSMSDEALKDLIMLHFDDEDMDRSAEENNVVEDIKLKPDTKAFYVMDGKTRLGAVWFEDDDDSWGAHCEETDKTKHGFDSKKEAAEWVAGQKSVKEDFDPSHYHKDWEKIYAEFMHRFDHATASEKEDWDFEHTIAKELAKKYGIDHALTVLDIVASGNTRVLDNAPGWKESGIGFYMNPKKKYWIDANGMELEAVLSDDHYAGHDRNYYHTSYSAKEMLKWIDSPEAKKMAAEHSKNKKLKEDEDAPASAGDATPDTAPASADDEPAANAAPEKKPEAPAAPKAAEPRVIAKADQYRVELADNDQVHIIDGKGLTRLAMPLIIWQQLARS